jgi:hypothetical protein
MDTNLVLCPPLGNRRRKDNFVGRPFWPPLFTATGKMPVLQSIHRNDSGYYTPDRSQTSKTCP